MESKKNIKVIPIVEKTDTRNRRLNVAAYCRVSTDSLEQLHSYKQQIDYYTKLINENPEWKMAGIFADEGISGTKSKNREQFNKMIRECKKGKIDLILTKSISRFSRDTLDCLGHIRALRELNIGILFEKEGIHTLEIEDEMILTVLGCFAQAESESLSKNIHWGFQQSFKAGKVPFHYNKFMGYRKGADGKPEIVPEEAEVIQRIFSLYLEGKSVQGIKKELEADAIPSPTGKASWTISGIQYMLKNERYAGDALLQKTFVSDMLSNKTKKNNGERPQYYISENHPPIIDRDTFNKVQSEIARRSMKRVNPPDVEDKPQKYSSKYALTGILVCGCCGEPYRRTTWARNGQKKIVWRCTKRLSSKSLCKDSVTLEEISLHNAIVTVINQVISPSVLTMALKESIEVISDLDHDRQILHQEFEGMIGKNSEAAVEYNDSYVRMLIESIQVQRDLLKIFFKDGIVVEQNL